MLPAPILLQPQLFSALIFLEIRGAEQVTCSAEITQPFLLTTSQTQVPRRPGPRPPLTRLPGGLCSCSCDRSWPAGPAVPVSTGLSGAPSGGWTRTAGGQNARRRLATSHGATPSGTRLRPRPRPRPLVGPEGWDSSALRAHLRILPRGNQL